MKFHAFLVVLITCLLTTGCGLLNSEDDDNDEILEELLPPEKELIPLEVGNYWVYEQWHIDPTSIDTVREEVLSAHDIIVKNTKIKAFGYQRFHYKGSPSEISWLRANGPEGLLLLGGIAPADTMFTKNLRYKYPADIGEEWEIIARNYNHDTGEFSYGNTRIIELIDTTKTVETPAGIFENCYVFKRGDFSSTSPEFHYYYIKPTVGIIGGDTMNDAGNDTSGQWRLLEYEIN